MVSHLEVTLAINAPLLEKSGTNKTIVINSADNKSDSEWTVTLTRLDSALLVSVKRTSSSENKILTPFKSWHIIPRSEANPILSILVDEQQLQSHHHPIHGKVDAEKVTGVHNYDFDIVLSADKGLIRRTAPTHCNHKELIALLLKDVTLTNVCFTIPSIAEGQSITCLWAHRSAFSSHKKFLELIAKGDEVIQDKNNTECAMTAQDLAVVIAKGGSTPVRVDKVAMSTFCVLLYYIYMGVVNLKLHTCQVFSGCQSIRGCPVDGPSFSIFTLSDIEGEEGQDGVPFHLDVKWEDLMEAADVYEISDLKRLCRRGIIKGLDKTNAVDILFGKTGRDPEIKQAAVEYIVENLDAIFEETGDPFDRHRQHPEHHSLLVKLMRLKAKQTC
ncbi:hypothetical protein BGZ95_004247 [Linnemannia exigua]|uniref:BTB domain-containing protein n=1 Tax=Linnemannia exigua TaxID=604196 RepID=A0AAD4DHM5_9FUNG|nr:hypothetical protein BGZ95_004247 [Linnemannia exigua]